VLDPQELQPSFSSAVVLEDMETNQTLEVSPEYARNEYRQKIDSHVDQLRSRARASRMDYFLLNTSRPLDEGLREYLSVRQGRM
jgi:hypothetical protein